jgi:DNA-binding winged helix-turn-helix (wHTH) protein/cytochrome c-type biogenesis protein CcmH/NrfG
MSAPRLVRYRIGKSFRGTVRVSHVRFGRFELDLETGELRRRGRIVRLSPRPMQVLTLLVRSPKHLVTREAIRKEVWGADTFVDFEHALNFCIREIRSALGDKAHKPRYIETLPRRGYRFIAEATNGEASRAPVVTIPTGVEAGNEAYNCYVRARKGLADAGKESLEKARREFERAVELDPGYAMAHSGLGAVLALRTLNRRAPEDLAAALSHLERACRLDAELAEPYPWLCYVLMRRNELGRALAAGHRGVELQPDLVHAHYFLGLAYFATSEICASNYVEAVRHLLDASATDPQWQATWFVLSYAALLTGAYDDAERYAGQLLARAGERRGVSFIGAEIVLGSVKLRRGEPEAAGGLLTGFLDRMAASDHMYRDGMSAAAACVLGDVRLRHGNNTDALAAYRRAWHILQDNPRIAAYQRLSARALSGLAAAYAADGERVRAVDLLARSTEMARESESPEHAAAAASMSEVYWSLATANVRLGDFRTGLRDARERRQDRLGRCGVAGKRPGIAAGTHPSGFRRSAGSRPKRPQTPVCLLRGRRLRRKRAFDTPFSVLLA